jgi:translation initiation factor IF-1
MRKNKKKNMAKNNRRTNSQLGSTAGEEHRQDKIELNGVVVDALPGTWFKVKVESGQEVLCTLSGKLRQNHIHILPADEVVVEVSPYDLTRGRISWRK